MPLSSLRWVTSQPDNVLSAHDSMLDLDQIEHSVGSQKYIRDGWQVTTLIRNLNPNMERVAAYMSDEVQHVTKEIFDSGNGVWKEVELYNTMRLIIAQVSSRFTVGNPLCEFLPVYDLATLIFIQVGTRSTIATLSPMPTGSSMKQGYLV